MTEIGLFVGARIRDKAGNYYEIIAHRETNQYSVNQDAIWQVRRQDGREAWVSEESIRTTLARAEGEQA